ncbi:transporter substrate-binding protein [Bradyrhizobium japonicum]
MSPSICWPARCSGPARADIGEVRRAAAGYRYNSPQGPVWIDGSNNHCVLTPRLAVSNARGQFDIFWEADAPVKPDPYLTQLDVAAPPSGRPQRAVHRRMRRICGW